MLIGERFTWHTCLAVTLYNTQILLYFSNVNYNSISTFVIRWLYPINPKLYLRNTLLKILFSTKSLI